MTTPDCHPDRPMLARGLCASCYNKLRTCCPEMFNATKQNYSKMPKVKLVKVQGAKKRLVLMPT